MSSFNLLDIANTISLRNIASSIENTESKYIDKSKSLTILISNELYEKEFKSTSPLNKEKLYLIIKKIISKEPKKLVIDLDVSPDFDFYKNINSANSDLYNLFNISSKDTDIVLPFAFYSKTKENIQLKREWMRSMCKNNINFALPYLSSQMGISLKYYDDNNSIYKDTLKNNSICKDIISSKNDIYSLLEKYKTNFLKSKQYPINFKNINSNTIILKSIKDLNNYDFKDKTIFLGGGYGYSDKFITPYGEKFGIQIHEAIFYT